MRELWQALMKVSEGGVGRVLRSRFRPTDGYRVWSVDSPVSRVVCATRPYRERWIQGRGIILGFTKSVPSRAFHLLQYCNRVDQLVASLFKKICGPQPFCD